ncbi:hypothetical protein Tco_1449363 [Tanacetum coccineum]
MMMIHDLELAKKLSLETLKKERRRREGESIHLINIDSERTESDTESGAPKGDKVQGEIVSSTVTSGVSILVSDPEKAHEAQAGPDPEPMQEDQTGSDSGKLHVLITPVIDFSSPKPSLHVTTPPINTEATSITTTLPEITPFIALQLRVAKLEQDMSEVKKTDHSAAALASP